MSFNIFDLFSDTPEVDPYHQRKMDEEGLDIEEYCNAHGYNIHEILQEKEEEFED
ncbi:hypothetical protein O3797_06610 [Gemella sanguinis]|jgi:hypothetical protein|uniref:hypothetical protein n=1 Tax=Gemella sanguinis TaxID=84135 RepID=UPI00352EE66A